MGEGTSETPAVLGRIANDVVDTLDLIDTPPGITLVTLMTDEFTSLCPVTAQPDFGCIEVEYVPVKKIVETKSFKLWLRRYRNQRGFNEQIVSEIAREFARQVRPRIVTVTGMFNPRGGVGVRCSASSMGSLLDSAMGGGAK